MENKKTPVAYELAERIKKEMLFSGKFVPEDHLPGEMTLAAELGAARSSVREALKLLAASGYVKIIPNRGAFALITSESELPGLGSGVMDLLESNRVPVEEMLDVRACIEPYAASLCASSEACGTIRKLERIQEEFSSCRSPKKLAELDYEFHRTILEESGNRLLGEICRSLLRYFLIYSSASNENRDRSGAYFEHQSILRAIENRSPVEAKAAMELHIEIAKRHLSERSERNQAGSSDSSEDVE